MNPASNSHPLLIALRDPVTLTELGDPGWQNLLDAARHNVLLAKLTAITDEHGILPQIPVKAGTQLEEACFFAIHQQTTMRFEITLKNASIEIVMDRISKSHFHRSYEGTTKGTVAFVRPPKGAIERAMETAKPAIVVFPRFDPESQTAISSLEKSDAFRALVGNTPNYMTLLETGFETLATLVETCRLYTLSYRNIDEAISLIESIDLGARGLGN